MTSRNPQSPPSKSPSKNPSALARSYSLVATVVELAVGALLVYALVFEISVGPDGAFMFYSRFLTMWSHVLQMVFFLSAPFLRYAAARSPAIQSLYDGAFAVSGLLSFTVSLHFWAIFLVMPDLIISPEALKTYPFWLNLVQHLWNSVFIVAEGRLVSHRFHTARDFRNSGFIAGAYLVWIGFIWSQTGQWPYPFFSALSTELVVGFIIVVLLSELILYKLLKTVCA